MPVSVGSYSFLRSSEEILSGALKSLSEASKSLYQKLFSKTTRSFKELLTEVPRSFFRNINELLSENSGKLLNKSSGSIHQ